MHKKWYKLKTINFLTLKIRCKNDGKSKMKYALVWEMKKKIRAANKQTKPWITFEQ